MDVARTPFSYCRILRAPHESATAAARQRKKKLR
jgi:hypothetical protein